MLKATDISNATFSKSMNGYKQEEVDALLDQIEADYQQFDRATADLQNRVAALTKENEELRTAGNSIQNVLVSAQLLADQIVGDAKRSAQEIAEKAEADAAAKLAEADAAAAETAQKAAAAEKQAEEKIAERVQEAVRKSEGMITAAHDSVARQQLMFDQLKAEVAAFKRDLTQKYKEHAELLARIPDEVPLDAEHSAEALFALVDREPDLRQFVPAAADLPSADAPAPRPTYDAEPAAPVNDAPAEPPAADPVPVPKPVVPAPSVPAQMGFQIQTDAGEPEPEPEPEEKRPAGGLFRKRK